MITLSHSDAPTGYSFGGYSSSDVTISNSSFTMPATNVTVNATWRKLLTNTDIAVSIPAQTYSGSALTPAVTVTDGTTELTKDTHYTVTLPDGRINAGDYTITWTFANNAIAIVFPTATAISNTAADVEAVKIINNGMLLIRKGDKTYNIMGQAVK